MLTSTLPVGCVFEEGPRGGEPCESPEVVLVLTVPGEFSGVGTRALSPTDEGGVSSIHSLVFDTHNRLIDIVRAEGRSADTFSIGLPASTEGMRVKLVLLANAGDILASCIGLNPNSGSFPSRDYNVLMPLISAEVTAPLFKNGVGRIPMWGESGYIDVQAGVQHENVTLVRSVARIDVGLGRYTKNADGTFTWNGLTGATGDPLSHPIPFEMTCVYVVRPNTRYGVAPVLSNIDPGGTGGRPTAIMPSVPPGTSPFDSFRNPDSEELFRYDVTGNYTTREIYLPEADIVSGGKNRHRDRMALVIGGYYAGETTESYYRVDFGNGEQLEDVLRNHLYTFSISNVMGSGYPSVQGAYNSHAMNMTVDVLEWDQGAVYNIWFEGSNYLAIDRQTIMFDPLPGQTLSMNIRTNIPYFEFFYADDPLQTVRFSSTGNGHFDGAARFGYVYTLEKQHPTMMADDEYVLRIHNPRDNIGSEPDLARRASWTIRALNLLINFHVDQRWSSGLCSLIDGQGSYLTPEGTAGKPLHVEVISLSPVEISATEVVGGVERPATWIDLGEVTHMNSGSGTDYYYYSRDLHIAPFRYGETRDGTVDRTATITVYIAQTGKLVNYTVSQQAPYVRVDRQAVSSPRPPAGSGSSVVPIYVHTNVMAEHLTVSQIAGDQNFIRLSGGGELVAYDPRNPGNRRFDVGVVYDPGNAGSYHATFGVSDKSGLYGDLPMASVDVVVPPANQTFDTFWRGASFKGAGVWQPRRMSHRLDDHNYVFPWNTTEIGIDGLSNIGFEPDPGLMPPSDAAALTSGGTSPYGGATLHDYTFRPVRNSFSTPGLHSLAFTSTLEPDLVTGSVDFRIGIQVFRMGDNIQGANGIDWRGFAHTQPATITITDNVSWGASVATNSNDGNWLRLRALNAAGGSTGTNFTSSFASMDDRVCEPLDLPSGQSYETGTTHLLVNDTRLQFVVDPLDFYVPFDHSQPESRTATITIRNNDYDATRFGASAPAPLTFTQWNRVLRNEGSDMPAYAILQPEDIERPYTFMARTNLDSWRVDIWAADDSGNKTDSAPLVSAHYSGATPLNAARRPVVVSIPGVELPRAGFTKRNLLVTLSADGLTADHEQRVGMWTQPSSNPHPGLPFGVRGIPAPPGVLGVGADTGRLTLRGSKEYAAYPALVAAAGFGPVANETVYVALFKRGSLIGISTAGAGNAFSTSTDVIWAPADYDVETLVAAGGSWTDIPSTASNQNYPTVNTAWQTAVGRGDPCGFADGNDNGNGPWKTPTGRTSPGYGSWDSPGGIISGSEPWVRTTLRATQWTLATTPAATSLQGWSFVDDPGVVVPYASRRDGNGVYQDPTSTWPATLSFWLNSGTGSTGFRIGQSSGGVTPGADSSFQVITLPESSASPIRCVPK